MCAAYSKDEFEDNWKRIHLLYLCNSMNERNLLYKKKIYLSRGGARGVMVIVLGNGHGDMSSNPEGDWLYCT